MSSTVDALHAALDADPANQMTRLVLADALEESGEEGLVGLAEGYRALAEMGKFPTLNEHGDWSWHIYGGKYKPEWFRDNSELPPRWFYATGFNYNSSSGSFTRYCYNDFPSRREAEDAAARAWGLLADEEKERILNEGRVKA